MVLDFESRGLGLGFRVWDLGLGFWDLDFESWVLELRFKV